MGAGVRGERAREARGRHPDGRDRGSRSRPWAYRRVQEVPRCRGRRDLRSRFGRDRSRDEGGSEREVLPRSARDARRRFDRRGVDRHAESLALARDDLGAPGGQARVRREADQLRRRRRSRGGRGRQTVRQARAARYAGPVDGGHARRARVAARWRHRRGEARARSLLQAAQEHRQGGRPAVSSRDARLRPVDGPGRSQAASPDEPPLRLALGLQHRQRRHRQPGCPSDGHRAMGARHRGPAERGARLRRAARL